MKLRELKFKPDGILRTNSMTMAEILRRLRKCGVGALSDGF